MTCQQSDKVTKPEKKLNNGQIFKSQIFCENICIEASKQFIEAQRRNRDQSLFKLKIHSHCTETKIQFYKN